MNLSIWYQTHQNEMEDIIIKDGNIIEDKNLKSQIFENIMYVLKEGEKMESQDVSLWKKDQQILCQFYSNNRDNHGRRMPLLVLFDERELHKTDSKSLLEAFQKSGQLLKADLPEKSIFKINSLYNRLIKRQRIKLGGFILGLLIIISFCVVWFLNK